MKNYWYITINDFSSGESKYIKAATQQELNLKVYKQREVWNNRADRLSRLNTIEELKNSCESKDSAIKSKIEALKSIVKHKYVSKGLDYFYREKKDIEPVQPFRCSIDEPNIESIFTELNVPKKNSFVEFLSKNSIEKRIHLEKEAQELYNLRQAYYLEKSDEELKEYNLSKIKTDLELIASNLDIKSRKDKFLAGDKSEVERFIFENIGKFEMFKDFEDVLSEFDLEYKRESKILILSRQLPIPEMFPTYSGFKYISTKKTVEGISWKQKDFDKLYDDSILQIILKSISNVFKIVPAEILEMIVINGWVRYIDDSKGTETTSCIISLEVDRFTFEEINLDLVNFKNCVKGLKGIFNSKIINLSPVSPILDIDRNDRRFVNSKDISEILYDGFNLATMEWEDFEYLVRQLFEKVFSFENSEVKITQASRDGGVDAVAFDPDPIRGGKFVIQAKRYNILVPVSAVRDLYGTMMHEKATRGILVTTSDYGPDAYNFVKDKSITLINGSQLLALLHKNGFNSIRIKLNR